MEDRVPTPGQEGRVLITPEDGSAPFYAKVEMADNPTQAGTPLIKETLLQDITCDSIGISHSSTPNEAFLALSLGIGKFGYIITVLLPDGSPAVGAIVTGGVSPSGDTPITNEDGFAIVVAEQQSINLSVKSPYIDISDSDSIQIQSTGILTSYTITLQTTGERTFTHSYSGKTSPILLTFDLCGVGAGGGGGDVNHSVPSIQVVGPGGGGGYVDNLIGEQAIAEKNISLVIGSGGQGGYELDGGNGGETSATYGEEKILTAPGGFGAASQESSAAVPGGTGNGDGGDGAYRSSTPNNGTDGTGYKFNDPLLGLAGGGGGGTGWGGIGGSPNGGDGSKRSPGTDAAKPGPGGGGGGGTRASDESYEAGPGGDGVIYFRPHYKGGVA